MAIALSGATAGNSGTAQPASIPVIFPVGAVAGHVAVINLHTPTGVATVTDPTGWTVIANGDGGNTKLSAWWKVLDAADITAGGITLTRSAGASYSWECGTWSGSTGVGVVSAQQATTTGTTSVTIPALTPAVNDTRRLALVAARVVTAATTASHTPPASWSQVQQAIDAHTTNQRRLSFVDSIQLVGQAGVAQATATATTDQSVTYQSYSLTLAPAAPVTAAVSAAVTATVTATAAVSSPTIAGFSQGFTKPAPFGVATVVPTPPPPPAPAPEVASALPRPVLQLGFSTDPLIGGGTYAHWSDSERGAWDTLGVWAPDEVWTDVTPWLLPGCEWRRGATKVEGPILRYEPGTLSAALNNDDGRFHPANLAGPYVSAGRSQVRPMLPARFGVLYSGDVYWAWRGFVEGAFEISYPSPNHSVATFNATDAQMVLSSVSRAAGPGVGAGESAGARVRRILTSVSWPTTDRRVDNGQTPLQATTLEGDPWAELLLVQDTELGEIYVDAVGKVVFKGRYAILTETLSTTSQATFGTWAQPGELPHESKTYDAGNVADIRNVHRIGRAGGVPQEVRDEPSVAEFLEHTHERIDLLMQTDTEAADYARYLLALSKDPADTFTELVIDPRAHPDLWPQVLTRDFGDRITIRSRPPFVGLIERESFIRGIAGEYRGTNQWRWTWALQPATRFNFGVWGAGKWGTSVWAY